MKLEQNLLNLSNFNITKNCNTNIEYNNNIQNNNDMSDQIDQNPKKFLPSINLMSRFEKPKEFLMNLKKE